MISRVASIAICNFLLNIKFREAYSLDPDI